MNTCQCSHRKTSFCTYPNCPPHPFRSRKPHAKSSTWTTVIIQGEERKFRSPYEANFALLCEWSMDGARLIDTHTCQFAVKSWEYEPRKFWFDAEAARVVKERNKASRLSGIRSGVTNYTPDFRLQCHTEGELWVEVKGFMDSKSRTKIKRFGQYYPWLKLEIVMRPFFKRRQREWRLLPGWATIS